MMTSTRNFLRGWRNLLLNIVTMMTMGTITITSLSACSSSDGDEEKVDIKEYLAGKEWTVNSTNGTYSFYKNHLLYYEGGGGVTSGGLASEPNIGFGYWQMDGDKLTTTFTIGRPSSFDVSNLLNEPLSGLHIESNNEATTGKDGSISIDQRPYIVGTFANGNTCQLKYKNKIDDISDETDHDAALRGTWYSKVRITGDAGAESYMGSMTFNEDGTMHMVIEGVSDYVGTYKTKNGQVTINGYLFNSNIDTFIYLNNEVVVKFYDYRNGYLSSLWYKDRSAVE